MSITEIDEPKRKGRPTTTPPGELAARRRILIRARNRAYSILAQRYPDEFDDLKNALLVRWGHPPINPDYQNRPPTVDETTE